VADGGSHAVGNVLFDYRHRKHPFLPFVNPLGCLQYQIAVVTVHQFVLVPVGSVIAHAGHGVAILPDGEQWEKLRRGLRQVVEEPRKSRGIKL
jgi:hypothetical protein